jgi:hypothetical protein
VEMLSRSCDASIELNALSHTLRKVTEQCKECMKVFLGNIKGYQRSLRDDGSEATRFGKVRDVGKKISWGLTQKGELAKFRAEINTHSSAINMLLITANM